MASAYRRTFYIHVARGAAGKTTRTFVSKREAERLKAAGENIEERAGKRWYVRYRDAAGGWHDERHRAHEVGRAADRARPRAEGRAAAPGARAAPGRSDHDARRALRLVAP
jgi:hypothetical protein